MTFQDRQDAGRKLAERVFERNWSQPIVLALPRGGVPLAFEVARKISAPMEILVARKVGAPLNPEYGIGAIAESGEVWIDEQRARAVGASMTQIQQIVGNEKAEVERRVDLYRRGRALPSMRGRSAILVDDGLATGVTAFAAFLYLKNLGAAEVVLAVPVGAASTIRKFQKEGFEVICLEPREEFYAVGLHYQDFQPVSDEEVLSYLSQATPSELTEVIVEGGRTRLPAFLSVPAGAGGIVIFAHGSGSSRFSTRNQEVARGLNEAGLATLLLDLLTPEEASDRSNVFNIPLLASRVALATRWVQQQPFGKGMSIGYFGASTGGGAALWAAAELGDQVSAVVSRGGRPDLAMSRLGHVTAQTLLLVGSRDAQVIPLNQEALAHLKRGELILVPGAGHLFEEPGALSIVTQEARMWFLKHLGKNKRLRAA